MVMKQKSLWKHHLTQRRAPSVSGIKPNDVWLDLQRPIVWPQNLGKHHWVVPCAMRKNRDSQKSLKSYFIFWEIFRFVKGLEPWHPGYILVACQEKKHNDCAVCVNEVAGAYMLETHWWCGLGFWFALFTLHSSRSIAEMAGHGCLW